MSKSKSNFSYVVQNVCLFCSKTHKQEIRTQKNEEKKSRNQKIFMFLCQMLEISNVDGSGDLAAVEEYDFIHDTLPLCPSCYKVFDELNSLVQQLESIESLIRNNVENIQDIIVESTTELERVSSKKKKSHTAVFRKLVFEKNEREQKQKKPQQNNKNNTKKKQQQQQQQPLGKNGSNNNKNDNQLVEQKKKPSTRSSIQATTTTTTTRSKSLRGKSTSPSKVANKKDESEKDQSEKDDGENDENVSGDEMRDVDVDFDEPHYVEFSDSESGIEQIISPVIVSTGTLKRKRKTRIKSEQGSNVGDASDLVHWSDSPSTTDEDENDPSVVEDQKKKLRKKKKVIDKKTFKCEELEKYAEKGSIVLERPKECRICGEDTPTEIITRNHYHEKHPNDQAFCCPEFGDIGGCDYKTNWFGEVKKHLVRMHPIGVIEKYAAPKDPEAPFDPDEPRPYLDTRTLTHCRLCSERKKSVPMLLRHVKIMHPGEKPFSCRFGCDFITSRPNRLRKHFFQCHPLEPLEVKEDEDGAKKVTPKKKPKSRKQLLKMVEIRRAKQAERLRQKRLVAPVKHRRIKCAWEKQHLCRICTFQGGSDSIMMNHFSLNHPDSKAFICPLLEEDNCEFATMWSYEIKRHVLRMHPTSSYAQSYEDSKPKPGPMTEEERAISSIIESSNEEGSNTNDSNNE